MKWTPSETDVGRIFYYHCSNYTSLQCTDSYFIVICILGLKFSDYLCGILWDQAECDNS